MKKNSIISLFAFCAAMCAVSCQISLVEEAEVNDVKEPVIINLSIPYPALESANGTKVTMNPLTGVANWVAGDKIVIYGKPNTSDPTNYVVHEITAGEISDPTVANITVDVSAIGGSTYYCSPHHYSIAYPADTWEYYSQWSSDGRGAFTNTNQLMFGGYVADDLKSATLFPLTSVIAFKVDGDFDSYNFFGDGETEVVGFSRYVYNMNASTPKYIVKYGTATYGTLGDMTTISGAVNGDGSTYNFICIPEHHKPAGGENESEKLNLSSGFTIQLVKNGIIKKYITSTAALTMEPGHYIDLGLLPSEYFHDYTYISAAEKASATELSNPKSANCYTLSAEGTTYDDRVFKFPAVKGNTYIQGDEAGTSVGSVDKVEVLWETWNTTSVTAKTIIKVVDYADGFVYFKTPETLHEGNALIAAKDSGGNILWSWHIWVPATDVGSGTYGFSGSKRMQDRNLGALVVADKNDANPQASGLFYQWGRKDPMKALASLTSESLAATSPEGVWTNEKKQASFDEANQHPTVFYRGSYLWSNGDFDGRWGASKTVNDPCPVGYKVPAYEETNFFGYVTPANYNAWSIGTYGFDAGTTEDGSTAFLFSGYPYYSSGDFDLYGTAVRLWTTTTYNLDPGTGTARALQVTNANAVSCSGQRIASAHAIRCIAE